MDNENLKFKKYNEVNDRSMSNKSRVCNDCIDLVKENFLLLECTHIICHKCINEIIRKRIQSNFPIEQPFLCFTCGIKIKLDFQKIPCLLSMIGSGVVA